MGGSVRLGSMEASVLYIVDSSEMREVIHQSVRKINAQCTQSENLRCGRTLGIVSEIVCEAAKLTANKLMHDAPPQKPEKSAGMGNALTSATSLGTSTMVPSLSMSASKKSPMATTAGGSPMEGRTLFSTSDDMVTPVRQNSNVFSPNTHGKSETRARSLDSCPDSGNPYTRSNSKNLDPAVSNSLCHTLKSENSYLATQLELTKTTLKKLRKMHLKELTEMRDKARAGLFDEQGLNAIYSILQEEPIMFFEPTDFILEEDTKEYIRDTVEEKMKLLLLKGYAPGDSDKTLKKAMEKIAQLEAELENANQMQLKQFRSTQEEKKKIEELEESKKAELADRDEEIRALKEELERKNQEIEDKESDLGSELDALKAEMSGKDDEITSLKQQLLLKDKDIEDAGTELEEANARIEEMQKDIEQLDLKVKHFEGKEAQRSSSRESEKARFLTRIEQLELEKQELEESLKKLESSLLKLKAAGRKEDQEEIDRLTLLLNEAKEAAARVERQLEEERERAAEEEREMKEKSVESLPERPIVEEAHSGAVPGRDEDLEGKYAALQAEFADLQQKYEGLQQKIAEFTESMRAKLGDDAVDNFIEEAGVADVVVSGTKPKRHRACDRLYEDALRRMRDQEERRLKAWGERMLGLVRNELVHTSDQYGLIDADAKIRQMFSGRKNSHTDNTALMKKRCTTLSPSRVATPSRGVSMSGIPFAARPHFPNNRRPSNPGFYYQMATSKSRREGYGPTTGTVPSSAGTDSTRGSHFGNFGIGSNVTSYAPSASAHPARTATTGTGGAFGTTALGMSNGFTTVMSNGFTAAMTNGWTGGQTRREDLSGFAIANGTMQLTSVNERDMDNALCSLHQPGKTAGGKKSSRRNGKTSGRAGNSSKNERVAALHGNFTGTDGNVMTAGTASIPIVVSNSKRGNLVKGAVFDRQTSPVETGILMVDARRGSNETVSKKDANDKKGLPEKRKRSLEGNKRGLVPPESPTSMTGSQQFLRPARKCGKFFTTSERVSTPLDIRSIASPIRSPEEGGASVRRVPTSQGLRTGHGPSVSIVASPFPANVVIQDDIFPPPPRGTFAMNVVNCPNLETIVGSTVGSPVDIGSHGLGSPGDFTYKVVGDLHAQAPNWPSARKSIGRKPSLQQLSPIKQDQFNRKNKSKENLNDKNLEESIKVTGGRKSEYANRQ